MTEQQRQPPAPAPQKRVRKRTRVLRQIAVLAALVCLAILVALYTGIGRRIVLESLGRQLAEGVGLELEAADFRLNVLDGRLVVDALTLGEVDRGPFLEANRVEAVFRWGEIMTEPMRLRQVVADGLLVRLDRLPAGEDEASDEPMVLPLRVDDFQVTGDLAGISIPENAAAWLNAVDIRDFRVTGSLEPESFAADVEKLRLSLNRNTAVYDAETGTFLPSPAGASAQDPLDLELVGQIAGPWDGPYVFRDTVLVGDGLRLALSGDLSGSDLDGDLSVDLNADPAVVLADLEAGSRLKVRGLLNLAERSAEMDVTAENVPSEALAVWIGEAALPGGGPSCLDLRAWLNAVPDPLLGDASRLTGEGTLRWSQEKRELLTADFLLEDGSWDADGVDPATLRGRARLDAAAVPATVLNPFVDAKTRSDLALAGTSLDAGLDVRLGLANPEELVADLAVLWRRGEEPLVDLAARTIDTDGAVEDGVNVRLDATLLGNVPGLREVHGVLRAESWEALADSGGTAITVQDGVLNLELPDLDAAHGDLRQRWPAFVPDLEGLPSDVLDAVALNATAEFEGTLGGVDADVNATWTAPDLDATGKLFVGWRRETGTRVDGTVDFAAEGVYGGQLQLAGGLDPEGELFDATSNLSLDLPGVAGVAAKASYRNGSVVLPEIVAIFQDKTRLEMSAAAGVGAYVRGEENAQLEYVTVDLDLKPPDPEGVDRWIDRVGLGLALEEGVLGVDSLVVETPTGFGEVTGSIPLANLLVFQPDLDLSWTQVAEGPVDLTIDNLEVDVVALSALQDRLREAGWQLLEDLDPAAVSELRAAETPEALAESLEDWLQIQGRSGTFVAEYAAEYAEVVASPLSQVLFVTEDTANALQVEAHFAALSGRLALDTTGMTGLEAGEALRRLEAELTVKDWLFAFEDPESESINHLLRTSFDPVVLNLQEGRATLEKVDLMVNGRLFEVVGNADLDPNWTADSPTGPVASFDARAEGPLAAGLLAPYAGGTLTGTLDVDAHFYGSPEEPRGLLKFASDPSFGDNARLVYATPYLVRFDGFEGEIELKDGTTTIRNVKAGLNDGRVSLDGFGAANGDWAFGAQLEDVRLVVDYGLSTVIDGNFQLDVPGTLLEEPASGRGSLMGQINVTRGVLQRSIDLGRELRSILSPTVSAAVDADDLLARIDTDLEIRTAEGVRVRNNIADLGVGWSALNVDGTLAEPLVSGTLDIEPGGLLNVFGQLNRIDQGTITLPGIAGAAPELDLQTTSAADDPTLTWGGALSFDLFTRGESTSEVSLEETVLAGLAGRLTERIGGVQVELRPEVLAFGETDPSTRLTLSRDLSRVVAVAVSVNLRDSQEQTYILDVHDLPRVPQVQLQVFTDAEEDRGFTFQQRLLLGKGNRRAAALGESRMGRILLPELPADLSERSLKLATGLSQGDPLPEGVDFETEVAVADHLRRRGYPGARVDVAIEERDGGRSDVRVDFDLGPRVVFEFEGEGLPVALRRAVTEPYRVDFFEEASRREVRAAAVRALRDQGFLEPEVEVTVDTAADSSRTVTVRSEGGRKVRLGQLVFRGIPSEVNTELVQRFESPALRRELALGLPEADAWLLSNLRGLGYADPTILGRTMSDDGRRLEVELDAGARQTIRRIDVVGLARSDPARELVTSKELAGPLSRPGEPARADQLAALAVRMRNELKKRGFADARVRTTLTPVEAEDPGQAGVDVLVEVTPGAQYRLEAVSIAGLRATRAGWAKRRTKLQEGEVLSPNDLARARRYLNGTRLFKSVRTSIERSEDGRAEALFSVDEAPRYEFAYGFRWESGDDTVSAVVDVLDRNFLGRGLTLGVRGLLAERERAGRFYIGRRSLFKDQFGMEFFVERRHEETRRISPDFDDRLLIDSTDATLQFSLPIGATTNRFYGTLRDEHIREKTPFLPDFPFDIRIRFPIVGWQIYYDTRDDQVDPTEGLFVSSDLSATGDYINSDFDFLRLFSQTVIHRPVVRGARRVTWSQAYRVGLFESRDEFPLSTELFRAGGEYSVRGYDVDSILDNGDPGQALLVVSQELRFDLFWEASGVVFLDTGGVWSDRGDFGSDLLSAAGLGLRASTPVGMLRLDFAWPLDRRPGDSEVKTYFGFGHAF